MSLGVVIKGPEGVVLAADSRITLMAQHGNDPPIPVNFDNATKLLSFSESNRYVGVVTYGEAVIGLRTAHSFVPEFELSLTQEGLNDRLPVLDFSQKLSEFFMARWRESMSADYPGPGMTFIAGGYNDGEAYGKVFLFVIPGQPRPQEQNPGDHNFGMTWGGQLQIASRLVHGYDPALLEILRQRFNLDAEQTTELNEYLRQQLEFRIPYQVLPLQDCVDLATFLIRTTIIAQRLAVEIRGVGGPIDVATITRTSGLEYIQRKTIRGEIG